MGRLIYSGISSLDGYIADEDGTFDWAMPDEEVHTFVNDLELLDEGRFGNEMAYLRYRVGA